MIEFDFSVCLIHNYPINQYRKGLYNLLGFIRLLTEEAGMFGNEFTEFWKYKITVTRIIWQEKKPPGVMNLIVRWYGIWANNWPNVKLIKARNLIFEAENSLCADNGCILLSLDYFIFLSLDYFGN